jgi:flavin-dependent dehydrogenase
MEAYLVWDVIVAGAGPGGSLTAKKCAENGFRTLLLERKKLPRDKVCSGMIAGSWAQDIIKEEFGEIPQETLVSPFHLLGQMFHVPGAEPRSLAWHTLIGWRKDLDAWMNGKAREAGAEIWDGAGVVGVEQSERRCIVKANRSGQRLSLEAKYVVAADGAGSVVRKSIFPELKVRYSLPVRECYETPLNLEPQFFHWFFPKARPRPRFDITFKGNAFLVEGSGIKELRPEITDILHAKGCDPSLKPLWKDACRIPLLHRDLVDGNFLPASDNVLLTGDAAGLLLPISFEGIGTALKSGQAAADSILEASRSGRNAGGIYLRALRPMIDEIERLSELEKSLAQQADAGPEYFCEALKNAYEETLRGQV